RGDRADAPRGIDLDAERIVAACRLAPDRNDSISSGLSSTDSHDPADLPLITVADDCESRALVVLANHAIAYREIVLIGNENSTPTKRRTPIAVAGGAAIAFQVDVIHLGILPLGFRFGGNDNAGSRIRQVLSISPQIGEHKVAVRAVE